MLSRIYNIMYKFKCYLKIKKQIQSSKKRVFLIGTPWHGNIGDQALVYAEKYLLNSNFVDYTVIEIPSSIYNSRIFGLLSKYINSEDKIFLQGGGNLGTLYMGEEFFHRDIIKKYPNNQIVIMPMSIFFHNNDFGQSELKISAEIYNNHKNLTIISRDDISFNFAKKYFYKVNNILAPDSVTSLDGILDNENFIREGICFFLRQDIEKVVSEDNIKQIKDFLVKNNIKYNLSDTADNNSYKNDKSRKDIIFSRLYMAKKAKLVITDRYHGVIFSVITHTPVIVFKSFDTKISAGVKWFKNLNWVHYIDSNNINEINRLIKYYCLQEQVISGQSNCKEIIMNTIKELNKEEK